VNFHSVREFCSLAFHEVSIEIEWHGTGINEKGVCKKTGNVIVEVDPEYFRPSEVEQLCGNPEKAKTLLGWNPRKTSFEELIKKMVSYDYQKVYK
jgi:GDPmannose 4,6-dehydratase